jgi:ribonucleoside-diphosphate reductase alpha chain
MRFEPSGFTNSKEVPIAKSVLDYIFRWMGLKFLPREEQPASVVVDSIAAEPKSEQKSEFSITLEQTEKKVFQEQADAPPCHECGSIMIRSGSCYKCLNCGSTSGCS